MAMTERARVELWTAVPDPEHLAAAPQVLGRDELERLGRMRSERAALEFASAHVLLRRVLAQLAPIEPRGWRFVVGEHGRPDLDPNQPGLPESLRGLSFNLSHTRGLTALAISRDGAVGVDVERRDRTNDLERLARVKFAEAERAWLAHASDEAAWRDRFFRVWTLKEAYLKARGVGITVPLADFAVRADDGVAPQVEFASGFEPDPQAWAFGRRAVGGDHELAVALRRREPRAELELLEHPDS